MHACMHAWKQTYICAHSSGSEAPAAKEDWDTLDDDYFSESERLELGPQVRREMLAFQSDLRPLQTSAADAQVMSIPKLLSCV